MRRVIGKLSVFCIIALILVASFWWGETSSPVTVENQISQLQESEEWNGEPESAESGEKEEKMPEAELATSVKNNESAVGISAEKTQPSEEKPVLPEKNVQPEASKTEEKIACSFSVSCNTVLDNIGRLLPEKHPLVPYDGVLYKREEVAFCEGDTVFDVLLREMTEAGIHMEFVKTPMYGNVYIEGIGNIYEFDCGELSGWMYRVNGTFPNFGCDGYKLKNGDKVEWVYTCNLGRDVGGDYFAQNGN